MRARLMYVGVLSLAIVTLSLAVSTQGVLGDPPPRGDAVVYVTSQNLYYDTVINESLPLNGPFQLLEMGADGLFTEFGPGDQEYVGGRWMADFDGDGECDYFSCPLLDPGRENP